jgi:hypothetical protein
MAAVKKWASRIGVVLIFAALMAISVLGSYAKKAALERHLGHEVGWHDFWLITSK